MDTLAGGDSRNKQLTALVVDDSKLIRGKVVETLSSVAVEIVGEAANGREAVELARRYAPDLIVLDIRMAGGSGIEVLGRIRRDNAAATVVMLSNYGYSSYRNRCAELGADFFLDKTKEFEQLRQIATKLAATKALSNPASPPQRGAR